MVGSEPAIDPSIEATSAKPVLDEEGEVGPEPEMVGPEPVAVGS